MNIVPVDIQWETMGPSLANLKEKITDKTVALVVRYSHGIIYDIKDIAKVWKQRNIDIIEDASEAFTWVTTPGSPHADFTVLSFGMLRHYTWFGGAVSVIRRNNDVYKKILKIEKSYRKERSFYFLMRVFRAMRLIMFFNSNEKFMVKLGAIVDQYKLFHYDGKSILNLRRRISLPWLRLLHSRLKEINAIEDLMKYDKLLKYDFGGVIPGCQAMKSNFYLYPIIFRESKKIIVAVSLL